MIFFFSHVLFFITLPPNQLRKNKNYLETANMVAPFTYSNYGEISMDRHSRYKIRYFAQVFTLCKIEQQQIT